MKSELRKTFKKKILSNTQRNDISLEIKKIIHEFINEKNFNSIGAYIALDDEINFLDSNLFKFTKVALPYLDDSGMRFSLVEESILQKNVGYDLEKEHRGVDITPEAIVVPALAFDTAGIRLGRGGGYYDRYLANYKGMTLGVSFNHVDELPKEDHDIAINYIIKNKEVLKVN
mgnify:CR=1 FL=1